MPHTTNVVKVANGVVVPGLGVVTPPKRLYWCDNRSFTGWMADPLGAKREYFAVKQGSEAKAQYLAALRYMSSVDRPLRDARMIETVERVSKETETGMAGVTLREQDHVSNGKRIYRAYVRALGNGLLPTKYWTVGSDGTERECIRAAMDYRERVVDLWHMKHELTVEDALMTAEERIKRDRKWKLERGVHYHTHGSQVVEQRV